jgi:uncharacterized protein
MKLSRRAVLLGFIPGLLFLVLMLRWFEHNQVFHPSREISSTGAELGRPFEEVWLESGGFRINGWFFPADTNSARAKLALLYCHGNAGNITDRLDTCRALLNTGAAVLMFDYRGYGRSQGRPSEQGTYEDAQAAYQWLLARGFEPGKIVAFGESLGGGVASELVLREPAGGLVLQSTFTSITDIGAELFPWLPVKLLGRIKFGTFDKLARIKVPVLVMHSRADRLIPFRHGERNFAAANEPKLFREIDGGHNDPLADPRKFTGAVSGLLAVLEALPAGTQTR